jgi:hypothetical protein
VGDVICKTSNRTRTKCAFKLCFRYFPNLVCNNSWLRGVVSLLLNYLWNVTCDVFMLNDAILVVIGLVWDPSWFWLTTRIIWAQVQKFERFGACFCTCALIIWTVLLQLASEQNSTLNTSYEYLKTKAFICEKCFQHTKHTIINNLKLFLYYASDCIP